MKRWKNFGVSGNFYYVLNQKIHVEWNCLIKSSTETKTWRTLSSTSHCLTPTIRTRFMKHPAEDDNFLTGKKRKAEYMRSNIIYRKLRYNNVYTCPQDLNWSEPLGSGLVTKKRRAAAEVSHLPTSPIEVVTQVWFHRLQPDEVLRFIMDVSPSCEGPCGTLSPAGTRGDKLLSLHLGRSSTYSTISAAISANGCVTLFQIDQLQRVGHGLGALLNQLWAITLSSPDLFCGPPQWLGATDGSPGWSGAAVSWECRRRPRSCSVNTWY